MLGDVYILGLGLDFSEADLWWLIDYKASYHEFFGQTFYYEPEKETGKTCIADPKTECDRNTLLVVDAKQCKHTLLQESYGVQIDSFGVTINTDEDYRKFYENAADQFRKEFNDKQSSMKNQT